MVPCPGKKFYLKMSESMKRPVNTLIVVNVAGTQCQKSHDFNRMTSVLKVAGIKEMDDRFLIKLSC